MCVYTCSVCVYLLINANGGKYFLIQKDYNTFPRLCFMNH